MTGDDEFPNAVPRVRQNVMHEIGFFQGRYGVRNVCLLYEENTDIPSNIEGLVYIPYPKGYITATFSSLQRELHRAFGR
ncbi:putative nucleotide-binding protein containing TIR-like domain protein [compost metagenome]